MAGEIVNTGLTDSQGNPLVAVRVIPFSAGSGGYIRTPNALKNVAATAITAGTPVGIWTPAAGKRYRVLGFSLSLSVAGSIIFKEAGAEKFRTPLALAGQAVTFENLGEGVLGTAAATALQLDVTANGNVSGFVIGVEE